MGIIFSKMHGAGNDFIVTADEICTPDTIKLICDRRKGVGADGMIFLSDPDSELHVGMTFFNNDGTRASMCGNGLRCAAKFAHFKWLPDQSQIIFKTDSGILETNVLESGLIRIELPLNREFMKFGGNGKLLVFAGNTGVPHAVIPVNNVDEIDVEEWGRGIRYHEAFEPDGINVDFIETDFSDPTKIVKIRTYERGVEAETLACGTGIGAAGCVLRTFFGFGENIQFLSRSGDILSLEIPENYTILKRIYLTGPAVEVAKGETTF